MEKEMKNAEMVNDEALEEVEGGLFAEIGLAAAMAFGAVTPAATEMVEEPVVETEHVIHHRNEATESPDKTVYGYTVGYYTTMYEGSIVRVGCTTNTDILNYGLPAGTSLYFDTVATGVDDPTSVWGHLPEGGWVCIADSTMGYCSQNVDPTLSIYANRNYVVHEDILNIRVGPSSYTDACGYFVAGDVVYVSDVQYGDDGGLWGATAFGWACIHQQGGYVYMNFA